MEKGERARERRKTWGSRGKDGFQDGRWEKSMRRLCWRYTRNRSLHEALENELNKQGLGGSGQNALEKMKEIENKY
jgi:hypothetical protein